MPALVAYISKPRVYDGMGKGPIIVAARWLLASSILGGGHIDIAIEISADSALSSVGRHFLDLILSSFFPRSFYRERTRRYCVYMLTASHFLLFIEYIHTQTI